MNQKLISGAILVFVAAIFLGSVFYFNTTTKLNPSVKSAQTEVIMPIPDNSAIVSSNNTQNTKVTSYTTSLTRDQIVNFYEIYAQLQKWLKINETTFKTPKGESIEIKIERDTETSNIVTLQIKKLN